MITIVCPIDWGMVLTSHDAPINYKKVALSQRIYVTLTDYISQASDIEHCGIFKTSIRVRYDSQYVWNLLCF